MDYIKQINAFERWCDSNYLPPLSQLLWYKIFKLNNRLGWEQWVQIDNLRLMAEIQVRREATFIELRNKLLDTNFIEYKKGHKGSPNRYRVIDITTKNTFTSEVKTEVETVVETVVETEVYPVVNTVAQTVGIYKHKHKRKHKQNKDTESPARNDLELARVISAYMDKINPTPSERSLAELTGYLKSMDAECCIRAIDIACDEQKRTWSYIRGILRNKKERGVRCIADWDALEAEAEARRGKSTCVKYSYDHEEGTSL